MKEIPYEDYECVNALGLASWADCADRLDTIINEIRHLQENIIYVLRAPILYRVLRFEEGHLWNGNSWKAAVEGVQTQFRDVVAKMVIEYPRSCQSIIANMGPSSELEQVDIDLLKEMETCHKHCSLLATFKSTQKDAHSTKENFKRLQRWYSSYKWIVNRDYNKDPKNGGGQGSDQIDFQKLATARKRWSRDTMFDMHTPPKAKDTLDKILQCPYREGEKCKGETCSHLVEAVKGLIFRYENSLLEQDIHAFIRRQLRTPNWTGDMQRHYLNLAALQIIKKNIVKDKLHLCREGYKTFFSPQRSPSPFKLYGRFLLLRGGIVARTKGYIARIADHQDQFAKTQDMGLQDHPRPAVSRRREQRLYSSYLSDRCRDVWLELVRLWTYDEFSTGQWDKERQAYHDLKNGVPPLFMHRWEHQFTSRNESFLDETRWEYPEWLSACESRINSKWMHYVNTSYFMPERPDIQTSISHEVCHSFLIEAAGNLSPMIYEMSTGEFYYLIRELQFYLHGTHISKQMMESLTGICKEIAVDILISTVQGPAYLYALFLEIIGEFVDGLFRITEDANIDLEMLDKLQGVWGDFGDWRQWYIRLSIVCTWIESLGYDEHPFGNKLVRGVRWLTELLSRHLESLGLRGGGGDDEWAVLRDNLCEAVAKSRAAVLCKRWLTHRNDSNKCYPYPNGARPLRREVRKSVLNWIKAKYISSSNSGEVPAVLEVLGSVLPPVGGTSYAHDSNSSIPLFQFLHDVPWQLTLIAVNVFQKTLGEKCDFSVFYDKLCRFPWGVREGYQYALDLHLMGGEPPSAILEECCRLLQDEKVIEARVADYGKLNNGDAQKYKQGQDNILELLGVKMDWSNVASAQITSGKRLSKSLTGLPDLQECEVKKYQEFLRDWYKMSEEGRHYRPLRLLFDLRDAGKIGSDEVVQCLAKKYRARDLIDANTLVPGVGMKDKLYKVIRGFLELLKGALEEFGKVHERLGLGLYPYKNILNFLGFSLLAASGNKDPYEIVIPALQKDANLHNDAYMLGRVSLGSLWRRAHSKFGDDLVKCRQIPDDQGVRAEHLPPYDTVGLLGRYDQFVSAKLSRAHSFKMPAVEKRGEEHWTTFEYFMPFFMRWELGLPVRLVNKDGDREITWSDIMAQDDAQVPLYPPLAFISVVLTRSTSRMVFLGRLLDVIRNSPAEQGPGIENPNNISELGGYFRVGDRAFLSDGWEDILIVLAGSPDRLDEVFKIQSAMYQDFQVVRTEIILTDKALDYALRGNDANNRLPSKDRRVVKLRVMYRLADGGSLEASNEEFVNQFDKNIEGYEHTSGVKGQFPYEISVSRTPGRMDYSVRLTAKGDQEKTFKKLAGRAGINWKTGKCKGKNGLITPVLYKELSKLSRECRVDKMQTNFGWLVYANPEKSE